MEHGYKLIAEIIELSVSKSWDQARLEWELEDVDPVDSPETCLCGHFPINEICILRNKQNGRDARVGNVCVKKFLGLPSDRLFRCIERITKDRSKPLNLDLAQHAHTKGWIDDWQLKFCMSTRYKRSLSDKQEEQRRRINEIVLIRVKRQASSKSIN